MAKNFDLLVVGAGPGGMAAGILAQKAGLSYLILEKGENPMQGIIDTYPKGKKVYPTIPKRYTQPFPVDEIRSALDSYRDQAETAQARVSELEERLAAVETVTDDAQPGTSIDLLRALDGAGSQSELLKELLPAISDHAARAVASGPVMVERAPLAQVDPDEAAPRGFVRLADRLRHLTRLAITEADPALATGPFITTMNDIMGLFIYFLMGRLLYGAFI